MVLRLQLLTQSTPQSIRDALKQSLSLLNYMSHPSKITLDNEAYTSKQVHHNTSNGKLTSKKLKCSPKVRRRIRPRKGILGQNDQPTKKEAKVFEHDIKE